MNAAKIKLSQKEMDLVTNADWILTKNTILKKIDHFLSDLQVKQKILLDKHISNLPGEFLQSTPKISKGENYRGLPYRMLDYPKVFNQSEIFAIRTMFLWGNFFSITLHLSGIAKSTFERKIINAFPKLVEDEMYCCINEDQWEHHFEKNNYIPINTLDKNQFEAIIKENSFCKLAYTISLQEFTDAEDNLLTYFKKIIELIAD